MNFSATIPVENFSNIATFEVESKSSVMERFSLAEFVARFCGKARVKYNYPLEEDDSHAQWDVTLEEGLISGSTNDALDVCLFEWPSHSEWLDTIFEKLELIYNDCLEGGWDGYNAIPISSDTYLEAKKFIRSLTAEVPAPEITPEPDGGIGFEWHIDAAHSIILSVTGNNLINYAGLFGGQNDLHGNEEFVNTIPTNVLNLFRRLY